MRRFGLIGRTLGHSASARYFAEKFRREGIAGCRDDLFELAAIEELPRLLERLPELCGFNVTIPYKQAVLPYLDAVSPEAARIGAVNCVRRDGTRLTGYNTDAEGVRASLDGLLRGERPARTLVCGTGGAAQAVRYVLEERGMAYDTVSRDPARGRYTYAALTDETVAAARLVVNATPLGTAPRTDESPRLPYDALTAEHRLFDLVYNPPLTRFLEQGARRGARILNGEVMLHAQAEAAWRIWNGDPE